MRVLMVSPSFPLPARRGEQVIVLGRIKELQKLGVDIDLVCLSQDSVGEAELNEVRKYCQSVRVILVPKWHSRIYASMAGLFSRFPMQVAYFFSFRAWFIIQLLLRLNRYDAVHVMLVRMAPMVRGFRGSALIELVDSMALNVRARIEVSKSWMQKLVWRSELRRIEFYERQMIQEFGAATVVSKRDRDSFGPELGEKIQVIPNGVEFSANLEAASPLISSSRSSERVISFVGNLSYRLNIEGIKWFVREVFPGLRARYPDLRLRVIGANPLPEVMRLDAQDGVDVLANVASVPEALKGSICTVVPLVSASGLQNKIIESLALGLPVVTSAAGADGLPEACRVAVRVASDVETWNQYIATYVDREDRRNLDGATGRAIIVEHCSWERSAKRILILHSQCEPIRLSNTPISASSPFLVWSQLGAMRSK